MLSSSSRNFMLLMLALGAVCSVTGSWRLDRHNMCWRSAGNRRSAKAGHGCLSADPRLKADLMHRISRCTGCGHNRAARPIAVCLKTISDRTRSGAGMTCRGTGLSRIPGAGCNRSCREPGPACTSMNGSSTAPAMTEQMQGNIFPMRFISWTNSMLQRFENCLPRELAMS